MDEEEGRERKIKQSLVNQSLKPCIIKTWEQEWSSTNQLQQ
jgi:hypothetical protein